MTRDILVDPPPQSVTYYLNGPLKQKIRTVSENNVPYTLFCHAKKKNISLRAKAKNNSSELVSFCTCKFVSIGDSFTLYAEDPLQ